MSHPIRSVVVLLTLAIIAGRSALVSAWAAVECGSSVQIADRASLAPPVVVSGPRGSVAAGTWQHGSTLRIDSGSRTMASRLRLLIDPGIGTLPKQVTGSSTGQVPRILWMSVTDDGRQVGLSSTELRPRVFTCVHDGP